MISIEKLRLIAKAKFSNKSNLGDWYQARLDICKDCPFNSANKEKWSVRETAFVTANLGKDTCLACGCGIADKASVRSEECGLVKIGMPPLWEGLPDLVEFDFKTLKVTNLNSDKVKIRPVGKVLEIDYGVVPHAFDSTIKFKIKSTLGDITNLSVVPACGCTLSSQSTLNGEGIISIGYDTVGRHGGATKNITINYVSGKINQSITCKLNINVERKN